MKGEMHRADIKAGGSHTVETSARNLSYNQFLLCLRKSKEVGMT